jgi:hypothetical protein
MDKRIEVKTWDNVKTRNVPPQIIVNLDVNDIDSIGDTITTVVINRNGKLARINLRLAHCDGKLKASVSSDGLDKSTEKTVSAKFCWENNNGEFDYPTGHPNRR